MRPLLTLFDRRARRGATLAVLMLLALVLSSPATAVTNGQPDGQHPSVGAVMADFEGFGTFPICSGTLLTETVFVTAAHCFDVPDGTTIVGVSFDANPMKEMTVITAYEHVHPDFFLGRSEVDIAVLTLDEPVELSEYAQLPEPGALERFQTAQARKQQSFLVVGYGSPGTVPVPGFGLVPMFPDMRRSAPTELNGFIYPASAHKGDSTVSSLLKFSLAPGRGGGACFGDSGGPNFLAGTNVIAAITVAGTRNCTGIYGALRLDTAPIQSFLAPFLGSPDAG